MAKASPVVGHHGQDSEPEVKNVQIFSNGDRFAPGRHVVLNTRQIRNFETFLDELTRILNPLHGAIRRLYTPVNGTPVEDTKDLREGAGYVAAGKEKFKKLSYYEIQPLSPRRGKGPKFPYFDIKPVTHSQFRVSGKVKKINIQNKKIVVFPNGQFFLPPSIIVLNQNDQASMDTVMHSVGIKVDLPQGGFPERLYTLDGLRVDSTEKVTNGTMYVAASHREKFKPGPYGPYMRMGQVKSRKSRATTRDTENGVFHVRPVKHKRSPEKPAVRQTVDYDKDVGGLFRSKNPLFDHAEVVDEMNKDEETVAEPIDHGSSLDDYIMRDGRTVNPEEDKSKKDYTGVPQDPLISVPDNIPPVSAEGTNVDEEPVFKEGSSKPAKGSTPEKAEIQVPTPEPKDDVAASPKEEARPIETAKTEEAPIKEEMNHPSIEVMNKSTRDKISESFPGQISSEQLNDFPKDQLNELNNNVQYDKPVSEPSKEIPKEQFSELSKEQFNESPNGHFSEQLKEGFGQISVQPKDPEVNIPKVDSSKHQQQENLSDKQPKVDVKEQGKEKQVDKSLSDKYKDEKSFSKQSKKESPHQSSGAIHDQGSQQICDQIQPMGVDSSPRIISNDKVHQLSTDSQPKEKTDDQSKVENNEQSQAQNAKELSKPTQMPFTDQTIETKNKPSQPQLNEPLSQAEFNDSQKGKINETLSHSLFSEKDQGKMAMHHQAETPKETFGKMNESFSKTQDTGKPEEKINEPAQSQFGEKTNEKNNEKPQTDLMKQSNEKIGASTESHFTDQNNKKDSGLSHSEFDKKPDEKMSETSSESQFSEQAHVMMNESQSKPFEQPHETLREALPSQFTEPFSPSPFSGKHKDLSEPSFKSQCDEPPREKMSESLPQTHMAQTDEKTCEPSSQSQIPEQHNEKINKPLSKSQFSEQPKEMSEHSNSLSNEKSQGKGNEPASQSHFSDQSSKDVCETTSQSLFTDKTDELSSPSQFGAHDKMNEPSSQSQIVEQPHEKMIEPQSKLGQQTHENMSEPSSQSHFGKKPHEKMSEPSSQSQFNEQPHEKMSEPSSQSQSQSQFSEQSYGKMNEPSSQSQFNDKQSHDKISEPFSQSHFGEKPNDKMSEPFSQSQFNEQPHEKMSEPSSQSHFSEPTHEKMSEPSSQSQFTRQLNDKICEPSSQSQVSEPPHEKISESSSVSQFDKQTHEKANELPSQIQYSEHSHDKDHSKFPTDLNENSQNFGKEFHEEVGQQQQPYSQFNDPFNQISKLTQDQSHENSQTTLGQKQQFTDKPCEKVMDQYETQFPDSSKQKIGGQHEEPANNLLQQTQFNDQLTQLKEQVTQQPQVHENVSQLPMNTYEELHKVSDLPQQDEFNRKSSGQFSDDHYQQDMDHVPEYAYQSVETPKQQSRESSPHHFSDASYDLVGDKSPLHFTDQTQNNFGQETLKQSTEEHFVQESKQQFEEPLPHNFCDKNIEKLSDQVQQQFKGIDEQLIGKENHEQTTQQSFAAFIDQPTEVINNKVHQLFSEQVIEENDVHQSHGIMVEQSKVPNNGQSQLENKNEFGNFDKDSISEQKMMTLQETAEKSNEKLKDIGMATSYDQFGRSPELTDDKKAVVEDFCDFSKVQTTECLREGQRKEMIVGQPDVSNNKDKQDAFESFPMKDALSKAEDTNKEKVNEFNQIENNNNDVKISSADLFASEIGKEVKEMVSDHSKTAGLNGLEKNDYHEMAKEVVLESQEQKNLKAAKETFDVNGLPKDNVKESSSQAIMPEQVHVMGKGDTALHESLMQSKEKDNKLEIASKDVKMSDKDESPKMDSDTTNEGKVNEKNEKSQQDDHLAEKETDKNGHQKDSVREQPNVPVTDKTQQH